MTLSYSTKINNKSTHFVPKILLGIDKYVGSHFTEGFYQEYLDLCRSLDIEQPPVNYSAKIHTIREDKNDRWIPGMLIHFVIFNRTKNRYQFAPVIPVFSIQTVDIIYDEEICEEWGIYPTVLVDNNPLSIDEMEEFAVNDGFKDASEFAQYFDKEKSGLKLIHWTSKRY